VIGSGGAGKTQLAIQIGKILDLDVIHLDALFWKPGWIEPDKSDWKNIVTEQVQRDKWVMDGNYGGTLDLRLPYADTVIFLNYNRFLCLFRVVKRRLQYSGKTRPDLPDDCLEQVNWEFFKWIWNYPNKNAPAVRKKLNDLKINYHEFNSPSRTKKFIADLQLRFHSSPSHD